jgi:hypothetical protein
LIQQHSFALEMRSLTLWAGAALAWLAAATVSTDGVCGGLRGRTCLGSTFGNCCSQYNYWLDFSFSNSSFYK